MKGILHIGVAVGGTSDTCGIGFIVGEQKALGLFRIEIIFSDCRMSGFDSSNISHFFDLPEMRLSRYISHGPIFIAPAPGVTKPEGGQDIAAGCLRAPIGDRDLD